MVDVKKLRSRMVLKGYNQKRLVAEMNDRGVKISENTFSSKMNSQARPGKPKSKFNTDDVDVICEILEVVDPAEKAEIFLA